MAHKIVLFARSPYFRNISIKDNHFKRKTKVTKNSAVAHKIVISAQSPFVRNISIKDNHFPESKHRILRWLTRLIYLLEVRISEIFP